MEHWIDHLVLAVPSLDTGIAHVTELLGVAPVPGGSHPGGGTHNALASLGAPTYLEVIAPDPDQPGVARRGFGLETPPAAPRLAAFAVGCSDIDATVARLRDAGHDGVADPFPMTRRRPDGSVLAWRLAVVGDHMGGAHPFLIEWGAGASPAADSPLAGRLLALHAGDPDPTARAALLATLDIDVPVEAAGAEHLTATIESPDGPVVSLG